MTICCTYLKKEFVVAALAVAVATMEEAAAEVVVAGAAALVNTSFTLMVLLNHYFAEGEMNIGEYSRDKFEMNIHQCSLHPQQIIV